MDWKAFATRTELAEYGGYDLRRFILSKDLKDTTARMTKIRKRAEKRARRAKDNTHD